MSKFWLGVENFVRRKVLSVENFVRRKILSNEFLFDRVSQKKEKVFEIESFNWLHRSFSLFMQQATKALVIKVMLLLCYFCPKILQNYKLHQIKVSDKNSSDKIIRRTKLSKFCLGVESFVRRKLLSVENFVRRNFVR